MASEPLVICEDCDAVHRRAALPDGAAARCLRCGARLYRQGRFGLQTMLALTVATAIVFVLANAYPIVTLELAGTRIAATLWGAVLETYDSGVGVVAALAAATVFFFPLLQVLLFLYVLVPLTRGAVPRHFASAMHALRALQPWSMVDVFMLGVLVAVVKLAGLAEVIPGVGLWAFAVLTLLLTALTSFDHHRLWDCAMQRAR